MAPSTADNCAVATITNDINGTSDASGFYNVGTTTIIWTVEDIHGNISTDTQDITVTDDESPIASCQDFTVNLDPGTGAASIAATDIDNGSTDNCGITTMSVTPNAFTSANLGANTVTLSIEDAAGHISTCTATVTVTDLTPPVAVCQDITVELDATGTASIVGTDIDNGSYDNGVVVSLDANPNTFDCTNVGVNTVTLTVTDDAGLTTTCESIVTVEDNIAPVMASQNVTIQLDASGAASITAANIDNGSYDNCDFTLTASQTDFACTDLGLNTITLTGTDASNNVSTITADVTVEDVIDPSITCGAAISQTADAGQANALVTVVAPVTGDNCTVSSITNDFNNTAEATDTYPVGTTTITWTVTDQSGNTNTCTQEIVITDDESPSIACEGAMTQTADLNSCDASVAVIAPTTSDNTGVASITNDYNNTADATDTYPVGTTTILWTVEDIHGNAATCTQDIVITDTENPSITAAAAQTQTADAGLCGAAVTVVAPTTADNCSVASITNNFNGTSDASGFYNVGTTTITWTVEDIHGNISTDNQDVIITDDEAPIASCQDITVNLDGMTGTASIVGADVNNGSTDNCGIVSMDVSPNAFTVVDLGENTVILTLTDAAGNTSTCTSIVTIADLTPPTAICQDITIQLDNAGQASIVGSDIDNGSYDNGMVASLEAIPNSFDCSNTGINNVTLLVKDNAGLTATCIAQVTVEDNISPVMLSKDITVQLDDMGTVSITPSDIDNGSYDNCSAALTISQSDFVCSEVGVHTITLTGTDPSGNATSTTAQVTVEDNVNPIAITKDITVSLDDLGLASIIPADVDNGSNDACGIANMQVTPFDFDCSNVGPNTVELLVTDVNGNQNTESAIVTIIDEVAPIAICQDITIQLDATGNTSITAAQVDNGSNDACGIASLDVSPNTFDCSNVGGNTVTLTVEDVNGNVSSCQAQVTVEDITPPVAICQDITIPLDALGNASITGSDIDNGSNDACDIASLVASPNVFTPANVGDNTITLTVTDVNGNISTCEAIVTIQDITPPNAICQDIVIQLDDLGNTSITAEQVDNGSNDASGIASISINQTDFDCSHVGANTITLTVIDNNGNISTCESTVTVQDLIAPIAISQNITIQLDASGNMGITPEQIDNGSNDACGIASLSVLPNAFDCSHIGDNTVVLTVTDNNSNVSTIEAIVTVEDLVAPIAICQDITVQLDVNGQVSIVANQVDNGSNDACGIASMTVLPNTFDCSHVGANMVTLTVTDNNGNVSTCDATVNVEDNVAPEALCQGLTVQLDEFGNGSITNEQIDNGSNDACGIASLSLSQYDFDCSHVGSNTITLTVTDVNGNISTCESAVIVEDNIAPIAISQDITIQLDASGNLSITPEQIDNGSNDACGIASLSVLPNAFDCSHIGPNTVVLTVTDNNANVTTVEATVTVEDLVAPIAICQNITVQLDVDGLASITPEQIDNGSNDACGIASLSISQSDFDCSHVGPNTVTLTVTDVNGNFTTCESIVTIEDNIAPEAICQNIVIELDENGLASIIPEELDNGSNDACGIASLAISQSDFDCTHVGDNTVILTVIDIHNNVSTCESIVTVEDNITPVVITQNISIDLDETGFASITPMDIDNGSYDNCTFELSLGQSEFDCSHVGDNTVALIGTDASGNVTSVNAIVTVYDVTAPVITCPENQDLYIGVGCKVLLPDYSFELSIIEACGVGSITQIPAPGTIYTQETAGLHNIEFTVVDVNGNETSCNFELEVIDLEAFTILDVTSTNVMCFGTADGTITVATDGAPSGLFYSIDGIDFTNTSGYFTGIAPGNYAVYVKNTNDCMTIWSEYITITEPDLLYINDIIKEDVEGCYGEATGSIYAYAFGGTKPYQFSINGGIDWQPQYGFDDLTAGEYNLIVKDAHDCIAEWNEPIIIVEPPLLTITLMQLKPVFCYGDATGKIKTNVSGGTPPYQYVWAGPNGFTADTKNINQLLIGDYVLTVTDINGCEMVSEVYTITQPDEPLTIDAVIPTNITTCFGDENGIIEIYTHGGTPRYLYSVDGGVSYHVNNVIEDLPAGEYDILVIDTNSCITVWNETITLTQPEELLITGVSHSNVFGCTGSASGSIHISAIGGSNMIRYSIDGGLNYFSNNGIFNNLTAGIYDVKVKDGHGCRIDYEQEIVISDPEVLMITDVTTSNVTGCYGQSNGSIQMLAQGGIGTISYSINGGESYEQNGGIFEGVSSGSYELILKDESGCEYYYSQNPVYIQQPSKINMSVFNTHVESCNGDANASITINAYGGAGNYSYLIQAGGNWSSNPVFENLGAGVYEVWVMDGNNCVMPYENNPIVITEPIELVISNIESINPICFGGFGSITILSEGGTGMYSYSIDGGTTYQNAPNFNEVVDGEYIVAVQDENGCVTVYETPVVISEPDEILILGLEKLDEACDNQLGSIQVAALGGTGQLYYSIDNGQTYQTSPTFIDLMAETYIVKVKDENGCEVYCPENPVVVEAYDELQLYVSQTNVEGCFGDISGELHIQAFGGHGELSISIDGGLTWAPYQSDYTELPAGDYQVILRDSYNCEFEYQETVSITQPDELKVFASSPNKYLGCYGHTDGEIHITTTGGTGEILYSIDGGDSYFESDGIFENLPAGEYEIFAKDANGCIASDDAPIQIEQAEEILLSASIQNVTNCYDGNDGSIKVAVSGGVGEFEYSIDGGDTWNQYAEFDELSAGSYEVLVMDEIGCIKEHELNPIVITAPEPLEIEMVTSFNLSCYGSDDGRIVVESEDAVSFSIDNGVTYQPSPVFEDLAADEYYIKVKNANGCSASYDNHNIVIAEPSEMHIAQVYKSDVNCTGVFGRIEVVADKGAEFMEYSIDNGITFQASPVFEGLFPGNYNVVVSNGSVCSIDYEFNPVSIGDMNQFDIAFEVNDGNPACVGSEIELTAIVEDGMSYNWSSGQVGRSIIVSEEEAGEKEFTCLVIREDACSTADTVVVDFKGLPDVSIDVENEQEAYCVNQEVILEAYAPGAVSYQWNMELEDGPFNEVQAHMAGQVEYTVSVFDEYGCRNEKSIELEFKECGVSNSEMNIGLYPNPTDGKFILELIGAEDEVNIQIYDFRGRRVIERKIVDNSATIIKIDFDLEKYERGVYMIMVQQGEQHSVKRVVVQ
ncbi:HYR domain-containing protein [Lentimicrobium sp. L6]|uniref:HYR domain-containing protein n=3 Tax=unclassified Lentimicrobium TaxID=2677434 RepID=UPI001C12F44E